MTAGVGTRALDKRTVAGLEVTEWAGPGQVVLGLPGLGSNAASWKALAESLPEARVLSLDLRGRGAGMGMTGATGLRGHAKDVARVMAELDLHDVVVVGHSMGAFLAPIVYQEARERIAKLVLVDGGVQPAFPFFMGPRMTRIAFGKELRSMDKQWPSVEALAKKGKVDKILASYPHLRPVVLQVLEDQLVNGRPAVDVDRVVADAVDTFWGPDREALAEVKAPVELILAENAKYDGAKPFIADKAVAPWTAKMPNLTVRRLKGNHITVVFEPEVTAACAL
jgi:lipase